MAGENEEILDQSDQAANIEEDGGYLADPETQDDLEFREELFGDTGSDEDLGEAEDGSDGQVEAASLELEEPDGTVPDGNMPSPPPGFGSWEQAYEAQTQRARALEYQQQQQQYQQVQQAESRQGQQQQQGFAWQPPHQLTNDLQMAMRLRGSEGYDQLSPHVRGQADELATYMQGHWDRWTANPNQLVQDVVMPSIAPMLREISQQVAELKALEFRRKNQADLGNPEDVHRYLAMVDSATRDPYQASLQLLRAQKLLEEAQAGNQSNKTKSRDRAARQKSAKGKPIAKNRAKGRRGKNKTSLSKKERASAPKVADAVIRQMLEAGTLSQNELDG